MNVNWVWVDGEPHESQATAFFRRSFDLDVVPDQAPLHIAAAHIYQLYVNGTCIARGPHRADPRYPYYHTYDVAQHLKSGINHIVCVVLHFNRPEDTSRRWNLYGGSPGLAVELQLPDASITTDQTWQAVRAPGWVDTVQSGHRFHPPLHEVDLTVYNPTRNAVLDGSDTLSWSPVVASQITAEPIPAETPLHEDVPREAVSVETVHNRTDQMNPHPKFYMRGAADLPPFVHPSDEGAWLIFKLPHVMSGTYELTVHSDEPAQLDVYCGEGSEKHICDKLTIHGECSYTPLSWRGGEYVAVHIARSTSPVTLKAFKFIEWRYPYPNESDFHCNSEITNATWHICRLTAHQGTQDHLVDCVWREQALWVEDICVHGHAIRAAFGDMRPVMKSVRQALRTMDDRGVVAVPGPSGVAYGFEGEYLRWSCHALTLPTTVKTCYWYNADNEFARWCTARFEKIFEFYSGYVDNRGLINANTEGKQGIHSFGGWCPQLADGVNVTLNSQYAIGLADAADVARHIGRADLADQWMQQSEHVVTRMRELFWDEERCVMIDGEKDGKLKHGVSLVSNAWAVLAGAVPHAHGGAWAEALRKLPEVFPLASPNDASTLLKAYAKLDLDLHLRETLEEYYGSIVKAGYKTLPEYWMQHDPDMAGKCQDSSRCHPFGAGPLFIAHEYLLGVTALSPGYTKLRIAPRAAGLTSASGRVPTPAGTVAIAWRRTDSQWTLTVELPASVAADIELPHQSWDRQNLRVNGNLVWQAPRWDHFTQQARREYVAAKPRRVKHELAEPGRHVLELGIC